MNDQAADREGPAEDGPAFSCDCGHVMQWHHEERGCQYHGNGPSRCRCLRDIDTAILASPQFARIIAEAKAEAWDEGRAAQAARALRVKCSLVPVAKLRNPYRAALAAPETEGLT